MELNVCEQCDDYGRETEVTSTRRTRRTHHPDVQLWLHVRASAAFQLHSEACRL